MAQLDLASAASSRLVSAEHAPLRHIDVPLLASSAGLAVFGLFMIYSSTHRSLAAFNQDPQFFLKRQLAFLVVAAVALVVAVAVDYRYVRIYAPFFYLMALGLLVLVRTPLGHSALGAQRWFQLAGFQFSPSLFTRLALIVMLAAYLAEIKGEPRLPHVVRAAGLTFIAIMLVFVQP